LPCLSTDELDEILGSRVFGHLIHVHIKRTRDGVHKRRAAVICTLSAS
jgi:hypothetical protein